MSAALACGTYEVDVQIDDGTRAISVTWEVVAVGYIDNFGHDFDEAQLGFPTDTTQYCFVALGTLWFPACAGIVDGSDRAADLEDPAGTLLTGLHRVRHQSVSCASSSVRCCCSSSSSPERYVRRCEFGLSPEGDGYLWY